MVAAVQNADSPHCDHLVQVYRHSSELAEAAAMFLAAGFSAREPGVVIATAAHWPLIAERLSRDGWNTEELEAEGLLWVRDAATTLAAISNGHEPSAKKFNAVVGGLLNEATSGRPHLRVRAFGEMVDILVRRGEQGAADILEGYWNELAARRNFTLLCGYKIDLFDPKAQTTLLPQVYRSHMHVLAASDEDRVAAAVEHALEQVLGKDDAKRVYANVARSDKHAPTSQLALRWISAHMPRTAEEILAAAGTYYDADSAAA
jgi:MEDS: MEthanogen/methylotroph, DcmR Sensory domain